MPFRTLVRPPGVCFYPTIHDGGLDHIAKYYPNATLILLTRNTTSWYSSVAKWNNGTMLTSWINQCNFGPVETRMNATLARENSTYWQAFYMAHTHKIRKFVLQNLRLNYIEIELDDGSNNSSSSGASGMSTADWLKHYTGISSDCFLDCKPGANFHCKKAK